jgi:hypothetical protein
LEFIKPALEILPLYLEDLKKTVAFVYRIFKDHGISFSRYHISFGYMGLLLAITTGQRCVNRHAGKKEHGRHHFISYSILDTRILVQQPHPGVQEKYIVHRK